MIIKNAKVFHETDGFIQKDMIVEGASFADQTTDLTTIDADQLYAIPGLIDIHLHGCLKADFATSDSTAISKMLEYEASNGVTALCATTMTLSEEMLTEAAHNIKSSQSDQGSSIVGINLEGPFFSDAKLGAQNPAYLHLPDFELFTRLQKASGNLIKLLDIAPELDGALELISQLKDDVRCSLAHTGADYETAVKAFENGAKHVTHLFNAMPPLTHRAPGVIGAALDQDSVTVELICDGIHIHPSVVRATFKMFGDDRIILISDSMMATGLTDGIYELGGLPVEVKDNVARLAKGGNIAGSVTNLMNCMKNAVKNMKIPLHSAVKCASVNPAKAIGVYDQYGSIETGKYADFVLLDQDLKIKKIFVHGNEITPWQ